MKKNRHQIILDIIEQNEITTQDELMSELQKKGVIVTQATISRDIKDLKLVKQIGANGVYHYAPATTTQEKYTKYYSVFAGSLRSVECAQNFAVIKCQPGTANAICVAIDNIELPDVLGTIAGDDTIFVMCKTEKGAKDTRKEILTLMNEK